MTDTLAAKLASRPPLQVEGELALEVEGHAVQLRADGSTLRLIVPDEDALRAVVAGSPAAFKRRAGVARQAALLDAAGLRLETAVAGETWFRVGRGVKPSLTARLAGLGPIDAGLGTLLKLFRWRK